MLTNPVPEPRDQVARDIEAALADPEFRASLEEDLAALDRGEPLETFSDDEVGQHLAEQRRRLAARK
jgi:hypothetical protein